MDTGAVSDMVSRDGGCVERLAEALSSDPIAARTFVTLIARTCHAWVREYQLGTEPDAAPHWELAPDWHRRSTIQSVMDILARYYDHDAPAPNAAMVHKLWIRQKEEEGWRWGLEKSPAKKTHPAMVDWESLPREQRVKDSVFLAIVLEMAPPPPVAF